MRQILVSKILCLGIIVCLINCGLILPVMAFPAERAGLDHGSDDNILNKISSCTIPSQQNSLQQTPLSDTEKSTLIDTAGKNKKFSNLEATLIKEGYEVKDVSAYELQTDEGKNSNQVLTKIYVSNIGNEKTLIYMSNLDTGAIVIIEVDVIICATCLSEILASQIGVLGGCIVLSELSFGTTCYLALAGLAALYPIMVCHCSRCACSMGLKGFCALAEAIPGCV